MGVFGNLMNAAGAGYTAFREAYLNADPAGGKGMLGGHIDEWSRLEARQFRYTLNWAMYQNSAYREHMNRWSARMKTELGTTKHIRSIYNPAGRMGDFYQGHIWGGSLDQLAGDGESEPSALPIITDNEAIREPIAKLRIDSKWQSNKDICTLWGSVLAECGVRCVDDPEKGQVRKELVHPSHLATVHFDEQHNVKAYLIRKWVEIRDGKPMDLDPTMGGMYRGPLAVYAERCTRDGDLVVFETFKNGKPFAWNGVEDQWTVPYGFVPLVVASHRSIGLDWGVNCFHGGLPQFVEVDDQASCLGDNNRKKLNGPWYISGARGKSEVTSSVTDRSQRTPQQNRDDPEPSRTEMNLLYGPELSKPWSMTSDIDIAGMCEHIAAILSGIEKRYPELLADTGTGGAITAEAVRNARQIAGTRVQLVRPAYDDMEVRTNQMCLSIGGFRKYKGYEGINLDSFKAGKLDHQIGHRAVFSVDPLDSLNEDTVVMANVNAAVKVGIPLAVALERYAGWSEEDLTKLKAAKAAEPAPVVVQTGATGAGDKAPIREAK